MFYLAINALIKGSAIKKFILRVIFPGNLDKDPVFRNVYSGVKRGKADKVILISVKVITNLKDVKLLL